VGQAVLREDLVEALNRDRRIINLMVEPISMPLDTALYVVMFQERGLLHRSNRLSRATDDVDARVQAIEKELRATRTQLENTIDALETANEELKSSNEEYQSVNEEFQSTNEELESSKEELQSMNEELQTINAELGSKNEALAQANSDIKNLLDSTEIATLFLDGDLRIRNFTPAMADISPLRASDRGRPITDIATRLRYPDLAADVKTVLRSLAMIEREVAIAEDGSTYLMRIRPYRTVENVISGVVITFTEITGRKRAEEQRARLAAIIDSSHDAVIGHSFEGRITSWNAGAEMIFGYTAAEAIGKPLSILLPEHQLDEMPRILEALARGERVSRLEAVRLTKSGERLEISMTISPIDDGAGVMIGGSTVARDVSERKRADDLQKLLVNELNHRVKNTLATVQSIAARSLQVPADGRRAFDARLVALSRTHDLLSQESWRGTSLRTLLLQELEPHRSENDERLMIEGPAVELPPKAALALGMAFHELATNAAKHGALSTSTGRVHAAWDVARSGNPAVLRFKWAESGGPPVAASRRKGFGSVVLERGLTLELEGEVRLDFAPGGLVCTIVIPLPEDVRGEEGTD
jgi:two-component system, chemotaxis family, CheB/CheR fusion protein